MCLSYENVGYAKKMTSFIEYQTDKVVQPCIFKSKAETLADIQFKITTACVLPLFYFSLAQWQADHKKIIKQLSQHAWFNEVLIVRSSAQDEDRISSSLAGHYSSVINIKGISQLKEAVAIVADSLNNRKDQILIQPYLRNVKLSGVAFSYDLNTHAPYYVINYDDKTTQTDTVTAGKTNDLKCYIHYYKYPVVKNNKLSQVIPLIDELKKLFNHEYLDIEFAIDANNQIYLFQVRPLTQVQDLPITYVEHQEAIERISIKLAHCAQIHPYLHGKKTLYGVMPDWNPAEIIGIRPKPLALSLYKELITDSIWAYQRDNYGYQQLRSFPLLFDFEGLPYIDIRVSFNSFIPKELTPAIAERLVNFYLDKLSSNPYLHDKLEFDIVYSCYTLDLRQRLLLLEKEGFDREEQTLIFNSLKDLTERIVHRDTGLWKEDEKKIAEHINRQKIILASNLDAVDKIYWLIEDCKRYGTLPFAGLARAGFIAVQILKSLVAINIINQTQYDLFMSSVNSISSKMLWDNAHLSKSEFLVKYGHLRPGTYDILSPRYDESPDLYFNWSHSNNIHTAEKRNPFSLTMNQLKQIQDIFDKDKFNLNVIDLFEFIKSAIELREYSKFIFTKSVSEVLKLIEKIAGSYGISKDECAYLNIKDILQLYQTNRNTNIVLRRSVLAGIDNYKLTKSIQLPTLIVSEEDAWAFTVLVEKPNFITQKKVTAETIIVEEDSISLDKKIVFIPSADPGFDWIFSHDIVGVVTQYGGVNSHMAIRANELSIPAIIGAGSMLYNQWKSAEVLHIDCANCRVEKIR